MGNDGDKVDFVVKVTGTEPLDVQWAYNKKPLKTDDIYNISYANKTATLKMDDVLPEDSGEYSVVIKNQFGSVTSMASLKVKAKPKGDAPKITQSLTPQNVKEGEKVEFVLKTTGTEPLDIQWNFNKKPIKADKTYDISYNKGVAILRLAKALPENSGEYSVVLKNPFGSVNSMASLKVEAKPKGDAPKITQNLAPQNVKEGEKVEFVLKTTGTEPLDIQWNFNK